MLVSFQPKTIQARLKQQLKELKEICFNENSIVFRPCKIIGVV